MTDDKVLTEEMLVARGILDTTMDLINYHARGHGRKYSEMLTGEQYTRIAISAHIEVSRHPARGRR